MARRELSTGEIILKTLEAIGIKRIYGIIGTSTLDFVDLLYHHRDRIRYVTTRHEQVAVSMADGEARVTGRPGAALVHAGPGLLNSTIGLGIAYKDRVPILLISGGVKRRLHGTDAWLEVDQESLTRPITRFTARINSPDEAPETLKQAVERMLGPPPGPVLVEVAEDIWNMRTNVKEGFFTEMAGYKPATTGADPEVVRGVVETMEKAERPLILLCGEAAKPGVELVISELLERLGAYAVTTGNGRGACPEDHPRNLGRVGFGGGSIPADKALEEADYLLVLGNEFDDITTYAYTLLPRGDITVVSLDPSAEARPAYYELVKADPYTFAQHMLDVVRESGLELSKPGWEETLTPARRTWESMVQEALNRRYEKCVNPARFFKRLDEILPRDRIIAAGQGTHILYTYSFMKVYHARSFLAATNLGAMSYAFPAALGAKLAHPEREVVAVVGDGDFMMTLQDLETAVREGIPVKVIVVNDYSYRVLLLRQNIQKMGRVYGTILGNPDFARLAEAFGAIGEIVDRDDKIEEAVESIKETRDKPMVLDLRISRDDLPPLNLEASLRMSNI